MMITAMVTAVDTVMTATADTTVVARVVKEERDTTVVMITATVTV